MGTASYFYYNSDAQESQPGKYTPRQYQPTPQQQYQYQQQLVMVKQQQLPPQYIYCPPHSRNISYTQAMHTPHMLTPIASPFGVPNKQSYFVDQHSSPTVFAMENDFGPATPPLSAAGSATSSPPSSFSKLPTPANTQYMENTDIKYDASVYFDLHSNQAWDVQSPPLSPGKCATPCDTRLQLYYITQEQACKHIFQPCGLLFFCA